MDRRMFLQNTGMAAIGVVANPFGFNDWPGDDSMGIVVHSYGNRWMSKHASSRYPAFNDAIDLMMHCKSINAGGVQVMVKGWSSDFAKKVRDKREQLGLYLEGSIGVPADTADLQRFEKELVAAREAGAGILRTVTSGGRRYESFGNAAGVEAFKTAAIRSLQLAEPVLKKYQVKLAVENHKDWRADELVKAMKQISSEWIGVTLDFGNSISLVEDPMEVVEKLAPFVFSTHVKDMGVEEYADGFLLSEVPLGRGFLDLKKMYALCRQYNPKVAFSLEMITRDPLRIPCLKSEYWSVFEGVPATDLARTLRMVKEHGYPTPLPRTEKLNPEEKLASEENNILECLNYSRKNLAFTRHSSKSDGGPSQ